MAVQMGAVMVGQIAAFTPDYMKAKIAAARMFKLFDRIPGIQSDSEEGLQVLVSLSMIHILSYQQENSNLHFLIINSPAKCLLNISSK